MYVFSGYDFYRQRESQILHVMWLREFHRMRFRINVDVGIRYRFLLFQLKRNLKNKIPPLFMRNRF